MMTTLFVIGSAVYGTILGALSTIIIIYVTDKTKRHMDLVEEEVKKELNEKPAKRSVTSIAEWAQENVAKDVAIIMAVWLIPWLTCTIGFLVFGRYSLVTVTFSHFLGYEIVLGVRAYLRRRRILAYIKEAMLLSGYNPTITEVASKKFLKTFDNWIKPGRSSDEYYNTSMLVLREYKKWLRSHPAPSQ